jgi:nicotinate-nucleotide adenylyltransferase
VRLGILGGTFDPPHAGHLAAARAAASAADLDRVLMVPSALPPHKERPDLTDGYHRFAMVALLAEDEPALAASPAELRRGGVSYTVDTLRGIADAAPGDDLHLIVGSDSFVEMGSWRDLTEILERAAVVVVPRPGPGTRPEGTGLAPALARALREPRTPWPRPLRGRLPHACVIESEPVDVSSTEVRGRARRGDPIAGLVPARVEAYIRRQGLYGPTPCP